MEQMALDTRLIRGKRTIDPFWSPDVRATGTSWNFQAARRAVHPLEDPIFTLFGSGSVMSIVTLPGDYGSAGNALLFFMPQASVGVATSHTAQEMITFIRASLGLSITNLARATQMTRQTIYDWIDGQTPRADSLRRIDQLYRLATIWNRKCSWPIGKYLHHPLSQGGSLSDLLAAKTIKDQEVNVAMDQVCTLVNTAQDSRKRRSISERLRSKGFEPIPEKEFRANLGIIAPPADPDEG